MVYWIDHNGEKLGPMTAADVMRRASGETRVYNGETWFTIGEGATGDPAGPKTDSADTGRLVIRKAD